MDVDLGEQIAQVLSPDIARQLASTVGMDDGQGVTFVKAAIPALIAALADAAGGGGAKALSDAVSNSDPNAMERLRRALAARDLGPLNEGANALAPVLGAGPRDKLANALADHVDTPVEAALPALGAVEQAVVAVIGQQDPSLWSDAGALAKFLAGQKSAVAAAIPAALASAAAPAAPPAPAAARPTVATAPPSPPRAAPPPPPPQTSGGGSSWLLIVVVVVVVAAVAWFFWSKSHPKPEAGALPAATQFAQGAAGALRG